MLTLQVPEDTDLSSFADWRAHWTDYVALTRVMDDIRTLTARQGLLRSALHPGRVQLSQKEEPDQMEQPGRAFDFAVMPVLSDPEPLEQRSNGSAP